MNRIVICCLPHVLCSHTHDHLTSRCISVPSTVPYVKRTLVLFPSFYVGGTPEPNNLLQVKEGILVPNQYTKMTNNIEQCRIIYCSLAALHVS
jgi:hypothetical protein